MKLRYFYKLNHKKEPIPGSNVRRKSIPGPKSQWKEIFLPCCTDTTVECTCGPRYFVQVDGSNRPVDGSLIKRSSLPGKTEGLRLHEIQWKSVCCTVIEYGLVVTTTTGFLKIFVNGVEKVNQITTGTGSISVDIGDEVQVVLDNTGAGTLTTTMNMTGGHTYSATGATDQDTTFTYPGGSDVLITASITSV
jgi:hypothetical protein